jgi:hypothetical protein
MLTNNKDLSHIDNIGELRVEIRNVHARVKLQERDLNERLNRLPEESIKATVSSVIPSAIGSFLPGKSAALVTGALGLLLGKGDFEKGGWKDKATGIARQVSLFAILKGAYNLWTKRKL